MRPATTSTTSTGAAARGRAPERKSIQRSSRRVSPPMAVFVVLLCAYGYFVYNGVQWNADSRLALTYAIVDHRTLAIDAYQALTEDKAFANGHYYTDKAPGLSFLAVPVYAVLKLAVGDAFAGALGFVMRYLITLFVVAVPAAAFGAWLCHRAESLLERPSDRLLLALAYGLGTIAFTYSTVFYSHVITAILVFTAYLIARDPPVSNLRLAGAGLLLGYAVLTEFPAAIGAGLVGLNAGWRAATVSPRASADWPEGERPLSDAGSGEDRRRNVRPRAPAAAWRAAARAFALVGIGAIPPLALLGLYNWLAFGSPFALGYAHLGGAPEFQTGMSRGLLGVSLPDPVALWGITFSPYRGLFLLSPWLLLAVPGLAIAWTQRRSEAVLLASVGAGYLLFNSAYYFWDGGYSLGPRHSLPAIPFLVWAAAYALPQFRAVGVVLAALSALTVTLATATAPFPPPGVANPFAELVWPALRSGEIISNWGALFGLRGVASLLPLALLALGLGGLALWPGRRPDVRPE